MKIILPILSILMCLGSGFAKADIDTLEDAAKKVQRDSAAVQSGGDSTETSDYSSRSVEKAKNLKESMDRVPANTVNETESPSAVTKQQAEGLNVSPGLPDSEKNKVQPASKDSRKTESLIHENATAGSEEKVVTPVQKSSASSVKGSSKASSKKVRSKLHPKKGSQ